MLNRMKHLRFSFIFLSACIDSTAQQFNGETFLKSLLAQCYEAPCKIYSFSQKNYHYRNDSLIKNSVWHEAIEFPDKFRIWFGDKEMGNSVYFRNDSAYSYKAGKLVKSRADSNSLLLILGGMYYRSFEDVLSRLQFAGYNTTIAAEQHWNSREVMVIGALPGDLNSNQLWFDKHNRKVLRIIEKINSHDVMDMRFESYRKWCKGYVETKVSFYRNGQLEQVEEYYDLKVLEKFPE